MALDLWFYVSAGGFLGSLLLWPYLFVQYRKSSRHEEPDADLGAEPLVPIDVSDEPPEKMIAVPASALKGVQPVTVVSKTSPGTQRFNPVIPPKTALPGAQVFQPTPSARYKESSGQTQPPPTAQPAPRPVIQPGSTVPPSQTSARPQARSTTSPAVPADYNRQGTAVPDAVPGAPGGAQKIAPVPQVPAKAATSQSTQTLSAIKTGQTIPGGISPAVMYLQGVKTQLERLDKEMRSVKDQISHITQSQEVQFGTILRRLDEVKKELVDRELRAQPEPQAEPAIEIEPEPSPAEIPTSSEPSQTSVPSEEASELAGSQDPDAAQPPGTGRKGPVWPV